MGELSFSSQAGETGTCGFTWFLDHSIAGVCNLLPFGLIWVLVVVEVARGGIRVTQTDLLSFTRTWSTTRRMWLGAETFVAPT